MTTTSTSEKRPNPILLDIQERLEGLDDEAREKALAGEIYRLQKRLLSNVGHAVHDFQLIEEGDRILVGVSGGKDSLVLLTLLQKLQERSPVKFHLVAMNVDMGQPGFDVAPIRQYVDGLGVQRAFIEQNIYEIAQQKVRPGKSMCPICSRLRRGTLYTQAQRLHCGKIALGHHREDLVETLLLSALYAGALKTMPPRLTSDDGLNTVIRPMAYCCEDEIDAYAQLLKMPVSPKPPCETPDLQRTKVKHLLRQLTDEHPAVPGNLLNALMNVIPTHLLDRNLLKRLQEGQDASTPRSDSEWPTT